MTVPSSAHGFVRGALSSLSVLLLASGAAHAAIPATERQALLDLYASTNGPGWTTSTNWNGAAGTECTWYGVTCNVAQTAVTQIALDSNHLVGPLPASLGTLPGMFALSLNSNQLSGSVPSFATNPALKYLSLDDNQLTGPLPSFATNAALQDLNIRFNQLSGSIPSFAANTHLVFLDLYSNQLSGSIPSFASNTALMELTLANNRLSGPIPSFASNFQIFDLYLDSNQLSGSIPSFAGDDRLTNLSLSSNQLSGSIPSFASNTDLTLLNLSSNQLSGSIPSFAANTNLQILFLSGNQLSDAIPSFSTNTSLGLLALASNKLTGPVDPSLGTLTNLYAASGLDLRWNGLTSMDATLIAFLNSKQDGGDWQGTQTIPVTGLSVSGITGSQATVTWTPITYKADSGSYQVFTSTVSGGPYTPFATVTVNKSATSLTVTGLTPGTPYFFTVQTTTAPHALNQNPVLSGYSAEVPSATTPGDPQAPAAIPAAGPTALLTFAGLLAALGALRISKGPQ